MKKITGIVLKSLVYKENDKIVTFFSAEKGVVTFYLKGGKTFTALQTAFSTPFTVAEIFYNQGKSDMLRFSEGSILNQNLDLRSSFEVLQTATRCLEVIIKSQMPEKAAKPLYDLFLLFLERLPKIEALDTVFATFILKVMLHEGILQVHPKCSRCELAPSFRYGGSRFCKEHTPLSSYPFDADEEAILAHLARVRLFDEIAKTSLPSNFLQKVEALFEQSLK